jgi:sortase A
MAKHRNRSGFISWLGRGLIACGLVLSCYAAWNYWGADYFYSQTQGNLANEYSAAEPSAAAKSPEAKRFVDASRATHLADIFGRIYIPKLGDGYSRLVAEGVRWHPVLNDIGIGHYPHTQMPGEVGNFAVAAHRGGFGGAFKNIHRLGVGDHVYVETNDGWYSYVYRQTKIVKPKDVDVISAVPSELRGAQVGGRYLTLTSCNPIFVNTTRIIVWFELDSTTTLQQGQPVALSPVG